MTSIWCERLLVGGELRSGVRLSADDRGTISTRVEGVAPAPGDVRVSLAVPGFANAHSHLFHRLLRGRTHDDGGDFWAWRERMYDAAARLTPDSYRRLAVAVFGEMVTSGWTAVGEFHYVHHRPDGSPYPDHDMELALAAAAEEVGIRLTLLDTCYLDGGIGAPLSPAQRRFGDGSAAGWLDRWHALRDRVATAHPGGLVTVGAAIHSLRAVTPDAIGALLAGIPADVPLHVHLSEQPRENDEVSAAYGATPAAILDALGALGPRLSVVHATHPGPGDAALLGRAGVTVVMCPTTEADLGDGIGPARDLAAAGCAIAVGSDQNAVIDPLLELRGLEAGERLRSGRRGRFAPASLLTAGTAAGYRSLAVGAGTLVEGEPLDLVELDSTSVRTAGSAPRQIVLTATAADVLSVHVAGRRVDDRARAGLPAAYAAVFADATQEGGRAS